MEIGIEEFDEHVVVRPVGELDAYTVGEFRDSLNGLAEATTLVIDLSEVPFMDSAGLGALIGGIRRTRDGGGSVAVASPRQSITKLLHTTGFDRIVPVSESLEDAIEAARSEEAQA